MRIQCDACACEVLLRLVHRFADSACRAVGKSSLQTLDDLSDDGVFVGLVVDHGDMLAASPRG